jgi:hypothetical protein
MSNSHNYNSLCFREYFTVSTHKGADMTRPSTATLALIVTLGFAPAAMAQEGGSGTLQSGARGSELGRVVNGNTTTVFESAGTNNLDTARLQTWEKFAEAHPKIAKSLAYNSSLISDKAYLSKHPALDSFFATHPDIKQSMMENPGNFVAIPPRPGE